MDLNREERVSAEVKEVIVHTDLLQNKLIPDPFYRANEGTLQWIENASWEYRSNFQAAADVLKRAHIELVFEGLDGPADVYFNDKRILTANNAFRIVMSSGSNWFVVSQ